MFDLVRAVEAKKSTQLNALFVKRLDDDEEVVTTPQVVDPEVTLCYHLRKMIFSHNFISVSMS